MCECVNGRPSHRIGVATDYAHEWNIPTVQLCFTYTIRDTERTDRLAKRRLCTSAVVYT